MKHAIEEINYELVPGNHTTTTCRVIVNYKIESIDVALIALFFKSIKKHVLDNESFINVSLADIVLTRHFEYWFCLKLSRPTTLKKLSHACQKYFFNDVCFHFEPAAAPNRQNHHEQLHDTRDKIVFDQESRLFVSSCSKLPNILNLVLEDTNKHVCLFFFLESFKQDDTLFELSIRSCLKNKKLLEIHRNFKNEIYYNVLRRHVIETYLLKSFVLHISIVKHVYVLNNWFLSRFKKIKSPLVRVEYTRPNQNVTMYNNSPLMYTTCHLAELPQTLDKLIAGSAKVVFEKLSDMKEFIYEHGFDVNSHYSDRNSFRVTLLHSTVLKFDSLGDIVELKRDLDRLRRNSTISEPIEYCEHRLTGSRYETLNFCFLYDSDVNKKSIKFLSNFYSQNSTIVVGNDNTTQRP